MAVKLIVTDLDNTLLRRDKSISDYTAEVFERCRTAGILIAFATSRSEIASARFTKVITPDIFISNGGALAKRGGEVLYKAEIPVNAVNAIVGECVKSSEILQITVESDNGYFNSKPIDHELTGWVDYAHGVHTDFAEPIDYGSVYKITVETTSYDAVRGIASAYPEVDTIGFTGENWVQIKSVRASKELALTAVAEKLNTKLADVVAFGDDLNDLGMLKIAGFGVAMSNAVDELIAAVTLRCGDCDDDGVARWLEENVK